MTAQEVVWFINHKYGEQAYIVETNDQIAILYFILIISKEMDSMYKCAAIILIF